MKKTTRMLGLPMIAAAMLAAGTVNAMPRALDRMDLGRLTMSAGTDRDIAVNADTRYVNVTNGQTVTFEVSGKRFTFAFDAWPNVDSVPLSAIAPSDVMVPSGVRVYIAPNPLYQD
jgi:Heavy-metal resistance protein CzcE